MSVLVLAERSLRRLRFNSIPGCQRSVQATSLEGY
jgi:hypothetical protein